jgi:glycosyltransferase involved in cell wall biosynthesis
MTARLLVVVPAKDESGAIAAVVNAARAELGCDVLVVDDGSTDATAELAADAGATVVSLPYNLGVGGAIRTGLHYARQHGYGRVVQIDGDGQHDAVEAKKLVDALDAGDVDLVVGSRFATGYQVSIGRRLMMRALARTVSRRLGTKITDTTSGFRAMNDRTIDLFSRHYPVDYLSDTVEALLLADDAGLRVREIDVQMHQRTTGIPSASSAKSVYHLVRLLLILLLHSIRRPLPKEIVRDSA